jgi:predicted nucleic acid-binding protein
MSIEREALVFDTGPLSHFAREGWLGVLRAMLGEHRAVIPDTVVDELRQGVRQHPHLQLVLDASWIEQHELTTSAELESFAEFAALLVAKGRNRGEAGVLAYAKANGATAVIDDGPGRKAAQSSRIPCRGTLGLLCDALGTGLLTVDLVSTIADHLLEGEYRLPFKPGGFAQWAQANGLLPEISKGK